jgi:uncharacterized protein (TIGR03067 family)
MRIGSVSLALVCVLAGVAADDPEKQAAVAKELKLLEGTWRVVSIVQGGKEQPEDTLGETMTFEGGKLTERGNQADDKDEPRQFRLDPTCSPRVIDFDAANNNFRDADEVVEGVYRLDGDTLVVCINWESGRGAVKGNRPTALESKEGTPARLITLKRQKR